MAAVMISRSRAACHQEAAGATGIADPSISMPTPEAAAI
jgi:hypothetical protein